MVRYMVPYIPYIGPYILGNPEGISQNNLKGVANRCRARGPPQRRLTTLPVNPSQPRGHGEGENTVPQRHAELGGGIRRDFVARRGSEVVADEETHVLIFSKRPVFPRAPSGA